MSRQMKHCVAGELWGKRSHTQKNALALGSLSEQLADEGNKAKRCLTKATGSRIENELCESVSCYSQCL